ncbi:ATP-binding protein [sulfur-oxidizing endosymbiont of Gigantopelta aegis]|uniref:ATP-binding protein n=1 Tax=sulfur-oxidizing endosymbiont of Gigantopelta aegis TaxID=2794934 RepID=UPI001FE58179|nr:ATP-binding protein [sulfur-oxidizing endosymbiont of Gigantopelta aegis]
MSTEIQDSLTEEIKHAMTLQVEWQRIEILAQCLSDTRLGREPTEAILKQLRHVQQQVEQLRSKSNCWKGLAVDGLSPLALDLLACVYAAAINPNVALIFNDLQQGQSIYPSLAFLHHLLSLEDYEYLLAQQLLDEQGVLIKDGFLRVEGEGPMRRLQPHPNAIAIISGLKPTALRIPGAVQIEIDASWDDLIIPAPQRKMLHEYLLWVNYGKKIVDEWGARVVGGPIALFSGPSGTGKTFAASVIANALGWDLYRVDLGTLISKYIGETEKNLNALFDAVQGQKIVLQFDEVDALMGKRGEIKDARDRYANMEVSHLLSRIEQHHGPCILTTNLRKQIDQAFQRRFHFVMIFPRPEITERVILWQTLIPPKAPVDKDVDYQMIAEAVSLTGGEIRNAANHAAILAAAENSAISMSHIAIGVWRVLQKMDGQTRHKQLMQLQKFLPEDIIFGDSISGTGK